MSAMKDKMIFAVPYLILTVALMAVCFWGGYTIRKEQDIAAYTNEHHASDTTWFTIKEEIPVPSPPDTVVKTEYKNIPVPYYIKGDTDTIVDSVFVVLPYEQHYANLDSVADVWYSGYDARIDSARVYKYVTTKIVDHFVDATEMVGLTLDVGIGNHEWQQFDPYVFAKATVSVNRWKIEPYVGYTYSRQPMFGIGVSKSFVLIK